jgi:peptide/nickel transport system substrate-binding protein
MVGGLPNPKKGLFAMRNVRQFPGRCPAGRPAPGPYVAVIISAIAFLSAACGSSPSGSSPTSAPTSHILKLAFLSDMGAPDPDVFYATEGLEVMTTVYQGLLQYANNSTRVVGDLAKSWVASDSGLTYTFQLQPGVTFHDGTPFNSAAVKFSFGRRTAIGQGPAYMLAHVSAVDTPSPTTVVVHLDQPVSAFSDYLASPFGPKMVSPTEISAHTVNNDWGQKWLLNYDAGTGPYEISKWTANQHYVLKRFPGYWGPKPYFVTILVTILPDITTQEIQLRQGELDMIDHGLSPSAQASFTGSSKFLVQSYPTEMKGILFINSHKGPFVTQEARNALQRALNKSTLTKEVYGSQGQASTQIFPTGELPASDQSSVVSYRPSVLKALVPKLPTKTVDIGFDPTDPRNQLLAEFIQVNLTSEGMTASTRAIPIGQIFSLASDPTAAPDILIQTTNPDAAHPDTWSRIYMNEAGGANYLQCFSSAADALMNTGLAATTQATGDANYGKAGNLLVKQGCFIDIADVQDAIVSRAGLTGFFHVPSIPWAVNLGTLRNG